MLWTDRDFITQADLERLDVKVAQTAKDAGDISLEGAQGVIRGAMDECGATLRSAMQRFSPITHSRDLTVAHTAAVLSTGVERKALRVSLSQIVVTDKEFGDAFSITQHWVAAVALRNLYLHAVNRATADDRYAEQFALWDRKRGEIFAQLRGEGVPFTSQPLAAPAATREYQTGEWDQSNLTEGAGGSFTAGRYYFAVTYTAADYNSSTDKQNQESAPGRVAAKEIAVSEKVTVDIDDLLQTVVQAHVGTARGVVSRVAPTGWNVYCGDESGKLYLQNSTPTVIATTSYEITSATLSGSLLDSGQYPDGYLSMPNFIQRG